MDELSEWVLRARNGDAAAFAEVVRRFQDMAYGYAFAYLGDFAAAEDAAQEAFIEAYRRLADLREPAAFPAWFKRVLLKYCDRETRRKNIFSAPFEASARFPSPDPGPATLAEQNDFSQRIQAAIRNLPIPQRVATTLYYINGYSQQDIADFLDVPVKTIKSRLHTSRQKLKERVIDMVHDEFRHNSLDSNFTQETVERAIQEASQLNLKNQYGEAETLLRSVLKQSPDHPVALKELNRALMRGSVYASGRWDLLPELAQFGRAILQSSHEEAVYRELACTLMAIPAMEEAEQFIAGWIAHDGVDLERLGMLAWVKGCRADYTVAETLWQEMLALASQSTATGDEIVDHVSFTCVALVDCFSSANQTERARRVAQEGWQICRGIGAIPYKDHRGDYEWVQAFHQAGLTFEDVADSLLRAYEGQDDLYSRGTVLVLRAYGNQFDTLAADWLEWVRACIAQGAWNCLGYFRLPMMGALRQRKASVQQLQLAQATWELLKETNLPETRSLSESWNFERFNFHTYTDNKMWDMAEQVAKQAIAECGLEMGAVGLIYVAAGRGEPAPAMLMQALEARGVEGVDPYGLFGWYLVAREQAASGHPRKALQALRRALAYWSNPPLLPVTLAEGDRRWGNLLEQDPFQKAIQEKKDRVGPIFGSLQYFPGW